jgi:hypothetical protein
LRLQRLRIPKQNDPLNLLEINVLKETSKKDDVFCKKGLRVLGDNRRTPLTGGAEAHNGTPDGAEEQGSEGTDGRKN